MVRRRLTIRMVAASIMGVVIRPRAVCVKMRRHSGARSANPESSGYQSEIPGLARAAALIPPGSNSVKSNSVRSNSVGSNRAPQPFRDLRDDVAGHKKRRCPDHRRDEIGNLKLQIGHFEYTGGERHRRPQRSEKAPDENARHA